METVFVAPSIVFDDWVIELYADESTGKLYVSKKMWERLNLRDDLFIHPEFELVAVKDPSCKTETTFVRVASLEETLKAVANLKDYYAWRDYVQEDTVDSLYSVLEFRHDHQRGY